MITPDVSHLSGSVFTRLELNCESPIEWAYYNSALGRKDVCAHCGVRNALVDKDLIKEYKTVLPLCAGCKGRGKQSLKRGPKNTAARAAKKSKKNKHVKVYLH